MSAERATFVSVPRFVSVSRQALADALLAAGPHAPTLCDGWETRHLAAHLVLRERSVWAAGITGAPGLRQGMERKLEILASQGQHPGGYARLIKQFAQGPQKFSPFNLKRVDAAANLLVYFVHLEDIRRARERWVPRSLDAAYTERLWQRFKNGAKLLYRNSPVGIILVRPDGTRYHAKKGTDSVAIYGSVSELIMHAFGRTEHALVLYEGSPEAKKALEASTAKNAERCS